MRRNSLTVLDPTHGRPTLSGRSLASLAACRLPAGYRKAVVVESGSRAVAEAAVAEAAEAHPHLRLRYMHVKRANKSHALNEALATFDEGITVFLDDDVRLEPSALDVYAERTLSHPEEAFFGGPLASDSRRRPPAWLLESMPYSVRGFTLADAESVGYYLGANWAAFTSDLQTVGGFVNYGPGSPTGARGQEAGMQRRLRKAGFSAVDVPDAMVWHYVPAERCSPRWGLQRRYQSGLQTGQLAQAGRGQRRLKDAAVKALWNTLRGAANKLRGRTIAYGFWAAAAWEAGYVVGVMTRRGPGASSRVVRLDAGSL